MRGLLRILKLHVQQSETQVCELGKVDEDFLFTTPKKHAIALVERQRVVLQLFYVLVERGLILIQITGAQFFHGLPHLDFICAR